MPVSMLTQNFLNAFVLVHRDTSLEFCFESLLNSIYKNKKKKIKSFLQILTNFYLLSFALYLITSSKKKSSNQINPCFIFVVCRDY